MINREGGPLGPHRLYYADGGVKTPRESRLAGIAVVLAFFSCPCVTTPFFGWLNNVTHIQRWVSTPQFVFGLLLLATFLGIVTLLRVRLSDGNRSGMFLAVTSLIISVLWWVMTCAGMALFERMGGRD